MRRGILMMASLVFYFQGTAQRDTIPLNDAWKFAIDQKQEGVSGNWFGRDLPGSRILKLPHTWNVEEGNQNHYGWGWYQKKVLIPKGWRNRNILLQFGAINHTSLIYVNGVKVHENIGDGFNKISVDLNGKLEYGKENVITVACNNDYGKNKVPFGNSFDWPNDGGLIRTVQLIVSGKPSVNYILATPELDVESRQGRLNIRLGFAGAVRKDLGFRVRIREENQRSQKIIYDGMTPFSIGDQEAILSLSLQNLNPWHFDFPNLYRIDVTVLKGRKAVDQVSTNIGFREFRFQDGQTFLNGERIKLMGVEWTAGSNPDFGFAEPVSEIIRHGKLMKDVNAIFSRQHFQQSDEFYDFCDRNGILIQEEIPLWGPETPSNDTIRTIALQQLRQMIRNHYNHPSIFAWGVGNELNGRSRRTKAMIEELIREAKRLDSTRVVSYVSNTIKDDFITHPGFVPDAGGLGDFIMMNEYGGSWWPIPSGMISRYLDSIHLSYPDKAFFISEFGLCEPNFKGGDPRRIEDLIYHMAVFESKPYVEGAIYFDLTDYRTHYPGTSENNKFRRRIHGVYDMYGKPKLSMKVLREQSSPVEVQQVHKKGRGKMNVQVWGSIGLPQHSVKGYKLYLSDREDNWAGTRAYAIPELQPGKRADVEVDDLFDGKGIITVVRPTGYVASQKSFY